jgi:fimbrial isopeptide formation D2 family protein/LPXTG-motif cell wall-anchored protein
MKGTEMIRKHSRVRFVASAAAALAVGAASLLGGTAANATETPDYGNINTDATGSIVIHKHEHQVGDDAQAGNPNGDSNITSPGVDGVTFTAFKLDGLDLTKQADWEKLADLTANADCSGTNAAGITKGAVAGEATTANGGQATISELDVAAYLVCETGATPESNVIDHATPFIVTIPRPDNGGWIYNVHAYPKNGVTDITKEVVTPATYGLGTVIDFPVTTKVPTVADNGEFTHFVVADKLDDRLGSPAVASVTSGDTTFVVDVDYEVITNGQSVRVEFTTDGLKKLAADFENQNVVTTFQGTVNSIGEGTITNSATVFVNDPFDENGTNGIPSNEVVTKWGDLRVQKINDQNPATALEGATFEVYAAVTPYADDCSAATPTGNAISIKGATTFTSDATGHVAGIDGLFVSDTETGEQAQRCYVIKETAAPAGYVLPEGDAAFTAVTVKAGTTNVADWDVKVKNSQAGVPELPMTGAQGQIIMAVTGGALLALAVGLVLARRRQATSAE